MDTNHDTEAQNKLFKYSFLPRTKRQTTLSNTITLLVENYLPCCKQKYLVKNYQQSSQYRSYKNFIPSYLHDRPRSVVLHCPTAQSSQPSPSMMLTVRRASLKLRKQVDIDMRSTLEGCLHAHVKIGYDTNCHVSTSLQYFSIGRSGNGNSYLQNIFRVPTSQ